MNDAYLQNEIAVVGSLLIDGAALEVARRILVAEDFEGRLARTAFAAACELQDDGEVVDAITIAAAMERKLGENQYRWIAEAMEVTPTASNVETYARLVKEDANRRKLQAIADNVNRRIFEGEGWQSTAEQLSVELDDIRDISAGVLDSETVSKLWLSNFTKTRLDPLHALCPTGYKSLDAQLGGGLFKQGLYIVGARPGMGKTTLGVNIAESIAKAGRPVLFVSLEMSEVQIMSKRISVAGGVGYTIMQNGSTTDVAAAQAVKTVRELAKNPVYTVAKRVSVAEITRAARQIENLAAIFVDYLGLIEVGEDLRDKPRYEQMTEVSAQLKTLSKRLNLPVVTFSQLNRENTSAKDKRPQMQNLRDTGAIEQDADGIILLHREDYYADKGKDGYERPEYETIELIVAKNRHGETGTVKMMWCGRTGAIRELKRTEEEAHIGNELPF